MSDGLREDAERIVRVVRKQVTEHGVNYERNPEDFAFGLSEPYELAAAYLAAPAWHKRPIGPGRWVCEPDGTYTCHHATVIELSQEDLERGAPFHTKAVFGPLPQCDA